MLQITLEAARVNAGYKLKDVGKLVGKAPKTISNWEKGITTIPKVWFTKLCELYGIDEDNVIVPNVKDGIYSE
jgi:transcriptional regulator with XRE-family HTH domain